MFLTVIITIPTIFFSNTAALLVLLHIHSVTVIMFRRLSDSLPKDPEFPADFETLGYVHCAITIILALPELT